MIGNVSAILCPVSDMKIPVRIQVLAKNIVNSIFCRGIR